MTLFGRSFWRARPRLVPDDRDVSGDVISGAQRGEGCGRGRGRSDTWAGQHSWRRAREVALRGRLTEWRSARWLMKKRWVPSAVPFLGMPVRYIRAWCVAMPNCRGWWWLALSAGAGAQDTPPLPLGPVAAQQQARPCSGGGATRPHTPRAGGGGAPDRAERNLQAARGPARQHKMRRSWGGGPHHGLPRDPAAGCEIVLHFGSRRLKGFPRAEVGWRRGSPFWPAAVGVSAQRAPVSPSGVARAEGTSLWGGTGVRPWTPEYSVLQVRSLAVLPQLASAGLGGKDGWFTGACRQHAPWLRGPERTGGLLTAPKRDRPITRSPLARPKKKTSRSLDFGGRGRDGGRGSSLLQVQDSMP